MRFRGAVVWRRLAPPYQLGVRVLCAATSAPPDAGILHRRSPYRACEAAGHLRLEPCAALCCSCSGPPRATEGHPGPRELSSFSPHNVVFSATPRDVGPVFAAAPLSTRCSSSAYGHNPAPGSSPGNPLWPCTHGATLAPTGPARLRRPPPRQGAPRRGRLIIAPKPAGPGPRPNVTWSEFILVRPSPVPPCPARAPPIP